MPHTPEPGFRCYVARLNLAERPLNLPNDPLPSARLAGAYKTVLPAEDFHDTKLRCRYADTHRWLN
jgi:hypothetical protein